MTPAGPVEKLRSHNVESSLASVRVDHLSRNRIGAKVGDLVAKNVALFRDELEIELNRFEVLVVRTVLQ
jgi:hypothetical protein